VPSSQRAGHEPASDALPVSLVCFGLNGTLVVDDGMAERSFTEAIATQGIVPGTSAYARCMVQVHQGRGRAAIDVLRSLFPGSEPRAQAALLAFDRSLSAAIGRAGLSPVPGVQQVMSILAAAGLRLCLLSGLSRSVLRIVLDGLAWQDCFDAVLCADDVPRGCPYPDLVLTAMLRLGVDDVRQAAVVHGTESGVLCGRRAGAGLVAAVLTGAHAQARLQNAGPDQLLPSVADLPALVGISGRAERNDARTTA
jgi:phosphonatase-like hydrolase